MLGVVERREVGGHGKGIMEDENVTKGFFIMGYLPCAQVSNMIIRVDEDVTGAIMEACGGKA